MTSDLPIGHELSDSEIRSSAAALLSTEVPDADKAVFLKSLRERGETADEIAGFVDAFLDFAIDPELVVPEGKAIIDVCGTGGDGLHLFNVSTAAMFVAAAGGVTVVKHGNRAITSKSGGADILEALGIKIDVGPAIFRRCIAETDCGFMFAPRYHPAFKVIAPVRRQLAAEGIPTIFNLLGPLLNPARPTLQLVGIFSEAAISKYAAVLQKIGRRKAWAVHGKTADGQGMDEISTLGPTLVTEVAGETIRSFLLPAPENPPVIADLRGGDGSKNAEILEHILRGGRDFPAISEIVAVNAGAALVIADVAVDLTAGTAKAQEIIAAGIAWNKVEALREITLLPEGS